MNRQHLYSSMLTLSIGMGSVAGPVWADEAEGQPDGGRWPAPQYQKPATATRLPMATFDAMRSAAVGFGAAAVVQSDLPPGISLQRGIATRVMGGIAPASPAPSPMTPPPSPCHD